MRRIRVVHVLYALVVAGYVAVLAWVTPRLPERAASHFDMAGRADGWTSRGEFLAFGIGVGALVLLGLPLLATALLRGSGVGINVPHKDYWLDPAHPHRRPHFAQRLLDDMLCISAMTGVLLAWVQIETVLANRRTPPEAGSWVAISLYLVAIGGYVWFIATKRYAVPDEEPGPAI